MRTRSPCSRARSRRRGSIDDAQGLCWTLFNLSDALSAAGTARLALQTAEESWELARSLDPGPLPAHAGCALCLALFNTGQAARAAELLTEAAGGEELRMIGGAWRGRYLEVFTRCLPRRRQAPGGRAAPPRQPSCAQEVDLPLAHGERPSSRSPPSRRTATAPESHACAAVAALESVGHVYGAAQARVVAGRALALAGERRTGSRRAGAGRGRLRLLRRPPLPRRG